MKEIKDGIEKSGRNERPETVHDAEIENSGDGNVSLLAFGGSPDSVDEEKWWLINR
jgi:hypothetical protein